MVSWGNWAKIYTQNHARDAQKFLQSVQLHISHQMKPHSMVKPFWRSIYTCFCVFGHWGKLNKSGLNTPNNGHRHKKVTHSVKPHITHQMKSYSNVKTILGSIYIYFNLVAGIGASQWNVAQIHQIFGRDTQKITKIVKPKISHQIKPFSSVKIIWGLRSTWLVYIWALEQVGEIELKRPK